MLLLLHLLLVPSLLLVLLTRVGRSVVCLSTIPHPLLCWQFPRLSLLYSTPLK